MKDVLTRTVQVFEVQVGSGTPSYDERTLHLLTTVNIVLGKFTTKRDERLALLSRIFDRDPAITTTKELKLAEALAFIKCAVRTQKTEQGQRVRWPDLEFEQWLQDELDAMRKETPLGQLQRL